LANSMEYVRAAHALVTSPPSGTLVKTRGLDTLYYHPASNTFAIATSGGVPRTMFRPADGMNYWKKQ
jgi:pyocin large subunit-like protein